MHTLFAVALLLTCFAQSIVSATAEPVGSAASEPAYTLDVLYDAEARTIEGSFDLHFNPEAGTAYFSLLANLDSKPNPYVSPRQQDAVYPSPLASPF